MARMFWIIILILFMGALPKGTMAQESLRSLSQMAREQVLDWRNPDLEVELNIPPGAKAATLTLNAAPGQILPASGSMMIVSMNGNPGVIVNPRPEAFSARIDLPAEHMRGGKNHIRISFDGANEDTCPIKADGGWVLDLASSRFDLSISANINSFNALEGWLKAGPWAFSRISIAPGDLDQNHYAAFGALITQALAVRGGKVPQIVPARRLAELDFTARIDPGFSGPAMALRPGARPRVELQGRNGEDIIAMARVFAGRQILSDGTRTTPAILANAPMVHRAGALDGVTTALAQTTWNTRPFINVVRTPHHGETRMVIDLERPDWVSPDSVVMISIDGKAAYKKRLKHQLNHFMVPLNRKSATVVRSFSIGREMLPQENQSHCLDKADGAPLRLLSARIETNGYDTAAGLSRFAIDGAPFAQNAGERAAILFTTHASAQLFAAWRAVARIALIAGAPLKAAWYGTDYKMVPENAPLLVLGSRKQLAPQLMAFLPPVFAPGAAAGPGDYELRHKKPGISVTQMAMAADDQPSFGLGVAGWTQMDQRPVLVLTGDQDRDFIPAMQAFAEGPAMNFFSGKVVRWRAGLVEINDIGTGTGASAQNPGASGWLYILAGLCLSGLWIRLWGRLYANWCPA